MLVAGSLGVATANELTELLDSAAEADYSGRQIVVTFLDGETRLEIVDVEHAGSLMMVGSDGSESLLGAGKLSGANRSGLTISSWNSSQMSERYAIGQIRPVSHLDRDATSIEILENGSTRMRLVFDDDTGTPMVNEIYQADGTLFRLTSMLKVDPVPTKLYSAAGHYSDDYAVLVPTARHDLPANAFGYHLADAYSSPDDSVQGFYSDGLFSFSLFEIEGSAASDRFEEASTMELDGRKYRRLINPGEMWITWRAAGNTFILVGDIPPDHLERVLAELPQPGTRNILSRLWQGLFG